MKSLIYLLPFVLLAECCYAQKVVGVSFGMSYEKCKQILDKRIDPQNNIIQKESNTLNYYKINFANVGFGKVSFVFENDGRTTYLHYICFSRKFPMKYAVEAKDIRDYFLELYLNKYGNAGGSFSPTEVNLKEGVYTWDVRSSYGYIVGLMLSKVINRKG